MVMPRDSNRERVRARQACRNCRKKKARCPSERPECSSCARLGRRCVYDEPPPSERLAELEQKVDFLLNGSQQRGQSKEPVQSPTGNWPRESPRENANIDASCSIQDPSSNPRRPVQTTLHPLSNFNIPSPTIPETVIARGINVYFQRFHRQPIWCFERQDLARYSEISTALTYSILELTSRSFDGQESATELYGESARWSVMLQMAKATVEVETIESLCLLSYSAFIDGDMHLGQLYLGLGLQLCRSEKLDHLSVPTNDSTTTEREKRLVWSIQLLERFYGDQGGVLRTTTEVWRPYFLTNDRDIAFPKDPAGGSTISGIGLWNLSLHFAWTWGRVREHVSEISQNTTLAQPWRLDSTYARVFADLTEIENKFPLCHRYHIVKFHERPVDEVQRDRDYWIPWLKLQFTWHSVLVMLNHPFLYITASQYRSNLAIPNTFWRRSLELVLLHATWIVRTIDLASEKRLDLVDPFLGHAAAIAATVHLYFCCVADPRLKQKSKTDFIKCKEFLKRFSSFSPACQRLAQLLDKLTRIAIAPEDLDSECVPSKIKLSIPLMWAILQFDISSSKSASTSQSFPFPTSTLSSGIIQETETSQTIEIGITGTSPAIKVDPSEGHDAVLPPYKPSATSEFTNSGIMQGIGLPSGDDFMLNTPWLWSDPFGYGGTEDLAGLARDPSGGGNPDRCSSSWNFGNL